MYVETHLPTGRSPIWSKLDQILCSWVEYAATGAVLEEKKFLSDEFFYAVWKMLVLQRLEKVKACFQDPKMAGAWFQMLAGVSITHEKFARTFAHECSVRVCAQLSWN